MLFATPTSPCSTPGNVGRIRPPFIAGKPYEWLAGTLGVHAGSWLDPSEFRMVPRKGIEAPST